MARRVSDALESLLPGFTSSGGFDEGDIPSYACTQSQPNADVSRRPLPPPDPDDKFPSQAIAGIASRGELPSTPSAVRGHTPEKEPSKKPHPARNFRQVVDHDSNNDPNWPTVTGLPSEKTPEQKRIFQEGIALLKAAGKPSPVEDAAPPHDPEEMVRKAMKSWEDFVRAQPVAMSLAERATLLEELASLRGQLNEAQGFIHALGSKKHSQKIHDRYPNAEDIAERFKAKIPSLGKRIGELTASLCRAERLELDAADASTPEATEAAKTAIRETKAQIKTTFGPKSKSNDRRAALQKLYTPPAV